MSESSSHLEKAQFVFDVEIAALRRTRARLDGAFDAAVETLRATLAGGGPGSAGSQVLIRESGQEEELPGCFSIQAAPGDVLQIETPGGGGYGKPRGA